LKKPRSRLDEFSRLNLLHICNKYKTLDPTAAKTCWKVPERSDSEGSSDFPHDPEPFSEFQILNRRIPKELSHPQIAFDVVFSRACTR
jgi:hypothetical protein